MEQHRNGRDEIFSFFRIISPSILQERRLPLPDNFVLAHGDGLSDTIRLVLPTGTSWYIGLKKCDLLFHLHDGWSKFMKHLSIGLGYFLLFNYRGKSEFGVHICDMTSIEIQYPLVCNSSTRTRHRNHVDVGEGGIHYDAEVKEEEEEEDYATHTQITLWKCEAVTKQSSKNSPRKPHKDNPGHARGKCHQQNAKATQLALVPCNGLEVKKEEDEEEDYAFHLQNMRLKRKAANKSFSKKNPRKLHKAAIPSHDHGKFYQHNARAKPLTSVPFNGFDQKPSSNGNVRRSSKSHSERGDRALQVAMMYKTKNPSFVVKLKDYNITHTYTMRVPTQFANAHMPHCAEFIELQDSDNNKCIIHSGSKKNGRMVRFGKGWSQFVKKKNLQIGDVCVFEVIKTNYILKVSIFPSMEEGCRSSLHTKQEN